MLMSNIHYTNWDLKTTTKQDSMRWKLETKEIKAILNKKNWKMNSSFNHSYLNEPKNINVQPKNYFFPIEIK